MLVVLVLAGTAAATRAAEPGGVQVFILAGQSNMEGKAANALLEYQAEAPQTRPLFAPLRRNGEWVVRDDVFIKFLERHGRLTIGYGSPNHTGLELAFGTVMGDHFDEPVLLIKTAWGGHSLYRDFRPPGRGLPNAQALQDELRQAQQRVAKNNEKRNRNDPPPTMEDIRSRYGASYRRMLQEVGATIENGATLFPELKGRSLELAGFVWFQGFNDMFGDTAPDEYAANMQQFIRDVRRDLHSPQLPFVIGALGQNGSQPARRGMLKVQRAQLSMNEVPEFRGNVRTIRTDVLVDRAAERLFPDWKENREAWQKVGSDRPYHYLGSAIWFHRIGTQTATAMLELKRPAPR